MSVLQIFEFLLKLAAVLIYMIGLVIPVAWNVFVVTGSIPNAIISLLVTVGPLYLIRAVWRKVQKQRVEEMEKNKES
mgnify:CR=1 FL=1